MMRETEPHLEKFAALERSPSQPSWVLPLRKAGISRFAEQGFPTPQHEDWRFTNLSALAKLPFRPVLSAGGGRLDQKQALGFSFGSIKAHRLVFVNGHFAPELSSRAVAENDVVVDSLAAALQRNERLLETRIGSCAPPESNPFAALNTAFFQDGGYVHVPAGKILELPVHLLFVNTLKESGAASHPRNLIVLGRDSQATVLESYASTVNAAYFTNAVTEVILEENAVLEHCKHQDESTSAFHMAAIHAQLGRSARFAGHSIATGSRLSRNNIRMGLFGEGVDCVLNGLYLTKGDQLADHHMVVEHAQPHCNSHEYYNGILDGRSKGVFHGRILVQPAGQKTDAKQTNKNLLLSGEATVDTKPQLEIYADDVKCTHGATVGQLNEESIFYLRSRGIGADTARRMLIHAFAGEIIERIRCRAAREELDQMTWNRLEANPHIGEQK